MTRVAIVAKPNREELKQLLPELIAWLRQHGYEPVLDREGGSYTAAAPAVDRAELALHAPQLVIVLGGDGTLLAAARIFATVDTPILSVNLGFLGFLTEVRLGDLYATLENWCAGCHTLDERAMLHAALWRQGVELASFDALNEVVVSKGDIARMGDFAYLSPSAHAAAHRGARRCFAYRPRRRRSRCRAAHHRRPAKGRTTPRRRDALLPIQPYRQAGPPGRQRLL